MSALTGSLHCRIEVFTVGFWGHTLIDEIIHTCKFALHVLFVTTSRKQISVPILLASKGSLFPLGFFFCWCPYADNKLYLSYVKVTPHCWVGNCSFSVARVMSAPIHVGLGKQTPERTQADPGKQKTRSFRIQGDVCLSGASAPVQKLPTLDAPRGRE